MTSPRLSIPLFLLASVALGACPDDHGEDVDTGDTNDTRDAGDTPDTNDTPDTSDTSDTGDTGGTDTRDTDVEPGEWPWPLGAVTVPADPSWKAAITFWDEPFLAQPLQWEPPSPRWVKFVVLTADPTRVFFQDSNAFPFHADFAIAKLPPFAGLTRAAFDAVTLPNAGKQAILGAVLFAPATWQGPTVREVGVQLVGQDPYDTGVALRVLGLVRDAITSEGTAPAVFYMPTYEQRAAAEDAAATFAAAGFALSSPERWSDGDVCLVSGWAVGRVVSLAASEVASAWENGRLTAKDILVVDQVPAELPRVQGIVSLSPASAASHVAILAATFETPFFWAATEATRTAISRLEGRTVVLAAGPVRGRRFGCTVRVAAVDEGSGVPASDVAALIASKRPPTLDYPAKVARGAIAAEAASLTRADTASFGGKAANFGILRRTIPEASPSPAIAFSFDLFDRLMAEPAPGIAGQTLRQAIDQRLAAYRGSAPEAVDPAALAADLAAVRDLVKAASFAPADETAVKAALASFDAHRKIRFRSSTNVEDTATFTGAGLYDSYSGCLADDLDGDATGPSACDAVRTRPGGLPADASEAEERGVFRALKKVYASFWNDNAFYARLVHGVDEARVAMGVLVHPSFPDEIELANGVALSNDRGFSRQHVLTTQLGAVSVTNPDSAALPEIVDVTVYSSGASFYPRQGSSLVPLGAHVMTWDADYDALVALLERVMTAWRAGVPSGTKFALDFEYKKERRAGGDAMVIKQVRPTPTPDATREVTSYLLPEAPTRLCTYQGEAGSLYGNHRNKVIVEIATRPGFLDAAARAAGLYENLSVTFADQVVSGVPSALPGAFSEAPVRSGESWSPRVDGFSVGAGAAARSYALSLALPWVVKASELPFTVMDDADLSMRTTWVTPQPDPDRWDGPTTTEDYVRFGVCPDSVVVTAAYPVVERSARAGAVSVAIRFYYPPQPTGIVAGYTAPLAKWDRTVITGLTAQPIELRGYWSQTFRPQHHNFSEDFLFEPRLEEGISAATLAELEADDIVQIVVRVGSGDGEIAVVGRDGVERPIGP